MARCVATVLVAGALACATEPRAQPFDAAAPAPQVAATPAAAAELIDHSAWQPLALDADPFWEPQRGHLPCGDVDWFIEGPTEPYLELHTGACNYLTLVQPSLAEVQRGDTITLALSHTSLNGADALGHAAITLGEAVLWSKSVPVRAEPESHNIEWTATGDLPEGARVAFHVHNHGDNSWRLLSLTRLPR